MIWLHTSTSSMFEENAVPGRPFPGEIMLPRNSQGAAGRSRFRRDRRFGNRSNCRRRRAIWSWSRGARKM